MSSFRFLLAFLKPVLIWLAPKFRAVSAYHKLFVPVNYPSWPP